MGKREILNWNKFMRSLFGVVMVMALMVSMVALTGCGKEDAEVKATQKPLKLYYVNEKFIETGDESKGTLVVYEDRGISIPTEPPEGMTAEEVASKGYIAAVTSLWEVPKDLEGATTLVTEKFGLYGITCKEGTAYVDLVSSGLKGSGGSLEETVFISQIVETLINSFDEIERVQFLIDGEKAESLMGHCDTSQPFTDSLFQ